MEPFPDDVTDTTLPPHESIFSGRSRSLTPVGPRSARSFNRVSDETIAVTDFRPRPIGKLADRSASTMRNPDHIVAERQRHSQVLVPLASKKLLANANALLYALLRIELFLK